MKLLSSKTLPLALSGAGAIVMGLVLFAAFGGGDTVAQSSSEDSMVASGPVADAPGPYLDITVAGEASGTITIDLNEAAAPEHTNRLVTLAEEGAYDGIVFHRVIDGFMAQTGDVQFGRMGEDMRRAGMGGSGYPNVPAEFSAIPFKRGIVGMARAQDPNSANSQFFIMFQDGEFLNGQYTVIGRVVEGMDVVDAIKRGDGPNGAIIGQPDVMQDVSVRQ